MNWAMQVGAAAGRCQIVRSVTAQLTSPTSISLTVSAKLAARDGDAPVASHGRPSCPLSTNPLDGSTTPAPHLTRLICEGTAESLNAPPLRAILAGLRVDIAATGGKGGMRERTLAYRRAVRGQGTFALVDGDWQRAPLLEAS